MKKYILVLFTVLTLSACGNNTTSPTPTSSPVPTTPPTTMSGAPVSAPSPSSVVPSSDSPSISLPPSTSSSGGTNTLSSSWGWETPPAMTVSGATASGSESICTSSGSSGSDSCSADKEVDATLKEIDSLLDSIPND